MGLTIYDAIQQDGAFVVYDSRSMRWDNMNTRWVVSDMRDGFIFRGDDEDVAVHCLIEGELPSDFPAEESGVKTSLDEF